MSPPVSRSRRFDGLDVVRAAAMLLGAVYHATYAYVPEVARWYPVQDVSTHAAFHALADGLHAFRMQVFFALSGFFAHLVMDRRGVEGFLLDRFKRLMVPFLVAAVPVMLLDWGLRSWALSSGRMAPEYELGAAFALRPAHLWFLQYLFVYCLVAWGLARRKAPSGWAHAVFGQALRVPEVFLLGAAMTAASLVWLGEPTPAKSFFFEPAAMTHYAPFFVFGWLLWPRVHAGNPLRRCVWMLPAALAVGMWHFGSGRYWSPADRVLTSVLVWAVMLGAMGWAMSLTESVRPRLMAVVEASYWIYLVHYPLVVAGQIALSRVEAPAVVKYAGIVVVVTAVAYVSFRVFIRSSRLGPWLGVRVPSANAANAPRVSSEPP